MIVQNTKNHKIYAMKSIKKADILDKKFLKHVIEEKNVLS